MGDMGADSTKLCVFDSHESDFNCGTKAKLLHYFEDGDDNHKNMAKCYEKLASSMRLLHNCCAVRLKAVVRSPPAHSDTAHCDLNQMAACAIVKSPVRAFMPTVFMVMDDGPRMPPLYDHRPRQISKYIRNLDRAECCTKALGMLVPPGLNLFNVILLHTDPSEPLVYRTRSVVTINVGGPTLSQESWNNIQSFIGNLSNNNWQKQYPIQFQPYSSHKFGGLNFNFVTMDENKCAAPNRPVKLKCSSKDPETTPVLSEYEALFEGDPIPVFEINSSGVLTSLLEDIEATSQFTVPILASDMCFSWTNFGMELNYSSGNWKCELCLAEAVHLGVPWESLDSKPALRTATSFAEDYVQKAHGVIRKPVFDYWPTDRINPHVMHACNGTLNTSMDVFLRKMRTIVDVPILSQNTKYVQLNQHINNLKAAIKTQQAHIQNLKKQKLDLHDNHSKARSKLANAIRGTVGQIRAEIAAAHNQITQQDKSIAQVQKEIADKRSQISSANKALKSIKGPMTEAYEEALCVLGIKLTTYFAGEFVGPQISKLAENQCYQVIFTHLAAKIEHEYLQENLDEDQLLRARVLVHHMRIFYDAFFKMYLLCKTTEPKSDEDINILEASIQDYCRVYRRYISAQVPPKVHYIEVHFVAFVKKYRTLWHAEEGIESFHHFRDSMNHCAGVQRKLQGLDEKIQSFQHPLGHKHIQKIKQKGRQRAVHKRPNRKKLSRQEKWNLGLNDQARLIMR